VVAVLAACGVLAAGFWSATASAVADAASDTVVFTTNGTYTVPDGVTTLIFTVSGGGGGSSSGGQIADRKEGQLHTPATTAPITPGGSGGLQSGRLAVTAGEVLTVVVGTAGGNGSPSPSGPDVGGIGGLGFGAGGSGGSAAGALPSAGGGGGGSAILADSSPLVVAGGGGGASAPIWVAVGSQFDFAGGDYCIPDAVPTCPTVSTTVPEPPTASWVDACPGLAPGSMPTALCPLGPVPIESHDGTAGVDAQTDTHRANGAAGGGGGGLTGGAAGVPHLNSLTTGGGQGGVNFADPTRTIAVKSSSADNVGGDGQVALTPVVSSAPSSTSTTSTDPSSNDATAPSTMASTSTESTDVAGTTDVFTQASGVPSTIPVTGEPNSIPPVDPDPPRTTEPRPGTKAATSASAPAATPVSAAPTFTG